MEYSTATVDDSLDVTHIWRRFQQESSQSYVDFDWDKAHEQVLSWIEDKDWEIFLARKGRELCGTLIGTGIPGLGNIKRYSTPGGIESLYRGK